MALFGISVEDQNRGEVIEPGWYPFEVVAITEKKAGKEAKNPGSNLTVVKAKGLDKAAKDHVVYTQFSEVAPGFVVPFAKAVLGVKFEKKATQNVDISDKTCKGKRFLGFIGHEIYNGITKNVFTDFRPMGPVPAEEKKGE